MAEVFEWVFEAPEEAEDGWWNRFIVSAAGVERELDLRIRGHFRHVMQKLAKAHQKEEVIGRVRIRDIPSSKQQAFGKAVADYTIADWGGPDKEEDGHGYGPPGRFCVQCNRLRGLAEACSVYGVPNCGCDHDAVDSEVRVWPLDASHKYLLLMISPQLDDDVSEFASSHAEMIEGTEEEQEARQGNLSQSPSSEEATPH